MQTPAPAVASTQTPAAAPAFAPVAQTAPTAAQMYRAARAYRNVLGDQLETLQDQREHLVRELRDPKLEAVDRAGLEVRLKDVDARIQDMDKQIAVADVGQAKAAGVPGATDQPPPLPRRGPPPEAFGVAAFAIFVIGFPIALAYARRIWRRSANTIVTLPAEVSTRMHAMEEAIESIAVEVERVGEGQRFMTQALADSGRKIGAGAAQPIVLKQRETVRVTTPI